MAGTVRNRECWQYFVMHCNVLEKKQQKEVRNTAEGAGTGHELVAMTIVHLGKCQESTRRMTLHYTIL